MMPTSPNRKEQKQIAKEAKRNARAERKVERKRARELRRLERKRAKELKTAEKRGAKGSQFWADRVVVDDWRVQLHVRQGRARVLDAKNKKVFTGTAYQEAFDALTDAHRPDDGGRDHVVFFLHGFGGRTKRMTDLCQAAREAGFLAEMVEYPSLFRRVDEIANTVAQLVIDSVALRKLHTAKVSLVAFSMGGLVASSVAHALLSAKDAPKLAHIITIGTPHLGSPLANYTKSLTLLGGPNITELTTTNTTQLTRLKAIRGLSFGVICGDGHQNAWTRLGLVGRGDGVVELASANWEGATDSLIVDKVKHTALPSNRQVIAGAIEFLTSGRFKK